MNSKNNNSLSGSGQPQNDDIQIKSLVLGETVMINGKSIPKIYGGFGDGQPCILAKQIAELHERELFKINQLINDNLDWFDVRIHIIDLKSVIIQNDNDMTIKFLLNFYSQNALNRSSCIYLFSQQGYAILCKFLRSDIANKIYKTVIREYFSIRQSFDWLDKLPAESCNKARDGYIYIIENPYGKVKIGKTINPVRRIQTIQTQGGFKAKKIFVSDKIRDYDKLESELHRYFRHFSFIGEWFSISYPIAVKAYYEICEILLSHTKIIKIGVTRLPEKITHKP